MSEAAADVVGLPPDAQAGAHPADACAALAQVLSSGMDVHRCLAAKALGRIGGPEAIPPLIAALLDEDPDVRTDAATALAALEDPSTIKPLLENLLGDPCGDVKLAALDGLVRLRSAEVAPWLHRLVQGRDPEIVWDEEAFAQEGWDDWTDMQLKAIEGLGVLGAREAVGEIVAALDDEEGQELDSVAFKSLARMGAEGLAALDRQLDHPNSRRRRRAATALADCSDPAAMAALGRALQDTDTEVRLSAFAALAARDPADPRMAALLDDADLRVVSAVARRIAPVHPERLCTLLQHTVHEVRQATLEAIAESEAELSNAELSQIVRDCLVGPAPQASAAAALLRLEGEGAAPDLIAALTDTNRPVEIRLGALRALRRAGDARAVSALIAAVGDDQRRLRIEALAALAALAKDNSAWPNPAGEALFAALNGSLVPAPEQEPDPVPSETHVRTEPETPTQPASTSTLQAILSAEPGAAARADTPEPGVELTREDLERLAIARRTPKRRRLPVSPDIEAHADVPTLAARMLGDLPQPAVATALADILSRDDEALRRAAADSLAVIATHLGCLPEPVVEALLAAVSGTDRDLRLASIKALAASDVARTADPLAKCLEDEDDFVRAEAIRTLAKLGCCDARTEAALADRDPGVRLAAAEAIAETRGPAATGVLVDFAFAFEGYHRRQAARLLRGLDAADASARLLSVLDDPERIRVWPVAIEALEELFCPSA